MTRLGCFSQQPQLAFANFLRFLVNKCRCEPVLAARLKSPLKLKFLAQVFLKDSSSRLHKLVRTRDHWAVTN